MDHFLFVGLCSIFSVITIKPSLGDTSMTGSPLSPGEVITIPIDWLTGRGKHGKHDYFGFQQGKINMFTFCFA